MLSFIAWFYEDRIEIIRLFSTSIIHFDVASFYEKISDDFVNLATSVSDLIVLAGAEVQKSFHNVWYFCTIKHDVDFTQTAFNAIAMENMKIKINSETNKRESEEYFKKFKFKFNSLWALSVLVEARWVNEKWIELRCHQIVNSDRVFCVPNDFRS